MLDVCHHLEMLTCGTVFGEQGLQKNACKYGNSINFFKIFKFRILKSINFKKKIQLLLPIAELASSYNDAQYPT